MNDLNLCLHCGASAVPVTKLAQVQLPEATKTYCPIPHDFLLETVKVKLADAGFAVEKEAHALTHDGARYFGLMQLVNGTSNKEHALVAGIRNSLDKSFAAGFSCGAGVFVCDNLSFTGEVVMNRKHTARIMEHLPGLITAAVSQTALMRDNQAKRFEFYQGVALGDWTADHLIMEMMRRGVIAPSRVTKIWREWEEPSHDFGPQTLWRLFNAATETLKGTGLHRMPGITIELQSILDDFCGFQPTLPEPIEGESERVH